MKKKLMSFIFPFLMSCSLHSQEIDFSYIRSEDRVYSTIPCNLDGDNYTDYIVNFITNAAYLRLEQPNSSVSIENSYFVTINKNGVNLIHHIDSSRYQFLNINEYSNMSEFYDEDSQLGSIKDFFFIDDFNNNGVDEVFLIEFDWYEEYLVGYELCGDSFSKIIDTDINGLYKYNFNKSDTDSLIFLRGAQYPGSQKVLDDGSYRDWLSYYSFNVKTGLYEEDLTEEMITKREDFF